MTARCGNDLLGLSRAVESRIVHDEGHASMQPRRQKGCQPSIEGLCVTGALKQHRCCQAACDQGAEQSRSGSLMAAARPIDLVSLQGAAIVSLAA